MRIDSPKVSNLTFQDGAAVGDSSFTGSFSGSFTGVGNFTGLTADSVEYTDVLNKPTLFSGSAQVDVTSTANYVAPAISDVSGTPTLVSGITAAEVRSTLGVDASGTDNSTDVTLVTTSHDYLSLSGQAITLGQIDISDDTNLAVSDTTGQTGIDLTLSGDTLSGTLAGLGTSASPTFAALTINGDIGVTGQVDGRDLATDGTKLDGIDSSATNTADPAIESDGSSPSLATGISAPEIRSLISVDVAGTDNSTNVTLAGTPNYITISGQVITRNTIDISDDTNLAVSDTTGQTGINMTLSGDTISGVVSGLDTTSDVTFNDVTVSGDLTVSGTTTSINTTDLEVTDKQIAVNRGGTTAASADGGGLFVSGANASLTWDNGNSRFNLNKATHVAGNITTTGTVDGRDLATDGTKLDGIDSNANNYSHPTFDGDDIDIDTTALTGATVISDLDINITTDSNGHVTDANGAVATRTLTLANLGFTGDSDANNITNNNQLTNGEGYTTNTGTVTEVTVGTGLDVSSGTTTPNITLDLTELGTATGNVASGDSFIIDTAGGTSKRFTPSLIPISLLNNDSGFTTYTSNQTLNNNSNVHFEGLMVGQTSGATANTIRCVGDIVAYYSSDQQFKDNIVTLDGALDKVKAIRGVRFDWNDKQDVYEGHDIGVIAQEVEAVLPELVHYREHNDSKAVDYVKLTAVLIEAVKELSAKVAALENN